MSSGEGSCDCVERDRHRIGVVLEEMKEVGVLLLVD